MTPPGQRSTDHPGGQRAEDTLLAAVNRLSEQLSMAHKRTARNLEEKHHENTEHNKLMDEKIDRVLSGFPEGDPEAHRRYHESIIEWRELRNKLVREALSKALQAGMVAGAGWVLLALWHAFRTSVR